MNKIYSRSGIETLEVYTILSTASENRTALFCIALWGKKNSSVRKRLFSVRIFQLNNQSLTLRTIVDCNVPSAAYAT